MAEFVDDAVFDNPRSGQPITAAGIHLGIMLMSIQILLLNTIQVVINKNLNNYIFDNEKLKFIVILSILTISGIINYFVVFKDKKYLIYFDDFNEIPRAKIVWYCVFCSLGYLSLIILTLYSFSWLKDI